MFTGKILPKLGVNREKLITGKILQVESPLSEMLGTRNVLYFGSFQILEYLHIHSEISLEWDLCLNTKSVYVSYTPYTYNLKVIYTIF